MKVITPALAAHYASGSTTLARLLWIVRRDGLEFAFTDLDQPVTYLGVTYLPSGSFDASAISTKSELNVDNGEVKGILAAAEGITVSDVEAGLWDGARFELLEVNYVDLSMGDNVLRVGNIGQVQRGGPMFVAELRGLMQAYTNTVVRLITPGCDADLGDARCKVNLGPLTVAGTVSADTDRRTFAADDVLDPDGEFDYGKVTWVTGENAGRSKEVRSHLGGSDGASFVLQEPMAQDIAIGDTFTLTPGCDKSFATCRDRYDNVLNFRGFPDVPGPDAVGLFGGQ